LGGEPVISNRRKHLTRLALLFVAAFGLSIGFGYAATDQLVTRALAGAGDIDFTTEETV
jgi:hypothetical protein